MLSPNDQKLADLADFAKTIGTTPDKLDEEQIGEALSKYSARREKQEEHAEEVRDRLRRILHNGHASSIAITNDGNGSWIKPRFWLGDDGYQSLLTGEARSQGVYGPRGFVLVVEDELLHALEGRPPSRLERSLKEEKRDRRSDNAGRPTKWDWEGMYIEANVIIYSDGMPATQTDLIQRLQNWFLETNGEEPSESEIKKRVSRLWRRFAEADK